MVTKMRKLPIPLDVAHDMRDALPISKTAEFH